MRIKEYTKLIGRKIILVPYHERHVVKYHKWMKNKELQMLTASEPLSLEDEYKMQAKWREDDDKCAFIILARDLMDSGIDEIDSMIGDINIFINDSIGELTIMIAVSDWRGKSLGEEAVRIMLKFALQVIELQAFEVRISEDNIISLKLFQKIGFFITSQCDKFHEYTLSIEMEYILKAISHLEMTVANISKLLRHFILSI